MFSKPECLVDRPTESFEADSAGLVAWFQGQPGTYLNANIEVKDYRDRGAGRGVVARSKIEDGECLFRVPKTAILNKETSQLSLKLPGLADMDDWMALVLVLTYENLHLTSSWRPYLNVLPETFDTLMYWSPSELRYLNGSSVLRKIGKEEADAAFKDAVLPLIRANPVLFPSTENQSDSFLLSLAHRMASTILAYSFDIEAIDEEDTKSEGAWKETSLEGEEEEEEALTIKGMVPMADMLNADADKNNARLVHNQDCLEMISLRTISEGEEIFNDYGDLPRSELLRRYGYIADSYSIFDEVELSEDLLIEVLGEDHPLENFEKRYRLDFLQQSGRRGPFGFGHPDATDLNKDQFVDAMIFLQVFMLSNDEFARLTLPPRPNLSIASPYLKRAFELLQKQYISVKAESMAKIHTDEPQSRKQMALQVIHGESQVIDSWLSYLERPFADKRKRTGSASSALNDGLHKSQRI